MNLAPLKAKKSINFPDLDSAKIWIIKKQFGRRNLSRFQRIELAMKLEPLIREKAKEKQRTSTGGIHPQLFPKSDKADKPLHTLPEVSRAGSMACGTLWRTPKKPEKGTEAPVEATRSGELSVGGK
jgi:hypothetical protein